MKYKQENKTKIIVSNRSALQQKYGADQATAIEEEMDFIIGMDGVRGISTKLVMLDDKKQLEDYAVNNPKDEEENKKAIDFLFENGERDIDYLTLFGGPDVIPFQGLKDPLKEGELFFTDLPYACTAAYGTNVDRFLAPKRSIGRLPDLYLPAGKKFSKPEIIAAFLRRMLTNYSQFESKPLQEYKKIFGMIAEEQKVFQKDLLQNLFQDSKKIHNCPPIFEWEEEEMDCLLHYFALFGKKESDKWYADSKLLEIAYGYSYKADEKMLSPLLDKEIILQEGALVLNQTSYGAGLSYEGKYMPLANVYFLNGAAGFLGSVSKVEQNEYQNQVFLEWMTQIQKGESLGNAFLGAVLQSGSLEKLPKEAKKAIAQWVMLGDSSYQPVKITG